MTRFLINRFVKSPEKVNDKYTRASYGTLSGIVGIILNVCLFALKLTMGLLSGSIAVQSSAFDHLSDSASSVITLFGTRLSMAPPDKEHPFGHGRMEYIASFIISSLILVVGLQFLKSSIEKIIHPTEVVFYPIVVVSLVISLLVKLWMAHFNKTIGKTINSSVMIAAADDSRNDCISTVITIISASASPFISFPLDGVLGTFVAIFIIKNGVELIKNATSDLVGRSADKECYEAIEQLAKKDEKILGIHDLILYNYGPGNMFGSCHAEVDKEDDILEVHDRIDSLEREIYETMGIVMTIHMDPIDLRNPILAEYRKNVENTLNLLDSRLSVHDFRMVPGPTHTNLVFDVLMPFDVKIEKKQLEDDVLQSLQSAFENIKFYLVISYDRQFSS